MTKILNLLLISAATVIAVVPIDRAQSNSICYMQDENGDAIDISHLCQFNTQPARSYNPSFEPNTNYENGVYSVPIKRRQSGIPVIDVKFNNRYTFEMMLDTGASLTVLTPTMAKKLRIKPQGELRVQTPSDKVVYMPWSQVNSVSAGDMISNDLHIAISPALDIGLLGQNFFGLYDITIKRDAIEFRERW